MTTEDRALPQGQEAGPVEDGSQSPLHLFVVDQEGRLQVFVIRREGEP